MHSVTPMKRLTLLTLVAGALLWPVFTQAQDTNTNSNTTTTDSQEGTATSEAVSPLEKEVSMENNLFRNGNFQAGKTGWRSHGKIVDMPDGKKALALEFNERQSEVIFTSIVPSHDAKQVDITLKLKVTDNSADKNPIKARFDIRILSAKENVYYYWKLHPKDTPDWQQFRIRYTINKSASQLYLELEPKEANGIVYLADVVGTNITQ